MHYFRPPSVLRNYLDSFTGTPEYQCDTSHKAPLVLDGNAILDPVIRQYRDEAVVMAKAERVWKERCFF